MDGEIYRKLINSLIDRETETKVKRYRQKKRGGKKE